MDIHKVCVIEAFSSCSGSAEFFEATVLVDMETGEILKEYYWLGRFIHWLKGREAGPVLGLDWDEAVDYLKTRQIPTNKLQTGLKIGGNTYEHHLEATRFLSRAGATEQETEKFLNLVANLLLRAETNRRNAQFMFAENSRMRDLSWFLQYSDCDFLLEAANALDCGSDCQSLSYESDTGATYCAKAEANVSECGGQIAHDLRTMYNRVQRAKEKSKWYLRLLGLPTLLKSGLARILAVRRKTS